MQPDQAKVRTPGNTIETRAELERKLSLLMVNTEESFVLVDLDLNIAAFNDHFKSDYKKYFGAEIRKGDSILDYARQDKAQLAALYQNVIAGKTIEAEMEVPQPSGELFFFRLRYKPAYDEDSKIIGVFVSSRDITSSRQTRLALQQSENRYRSIIENSLNAFILHEPGGKLLDANNAALQIFGYETVEEFRTKSRQEIIVYSDELKTLLNHRNEEGKVGGNLTAIRRNGDRFPCEFSSSVFKDINGKYITCSIVLDISERKKSEEALLSANAELEKNKQIYQSLFYHNLSAVFALDLTGNFTSANEVLAVKAETTIEHILTLHYSAFVHPDDLAITNTNFAKAKRGISQEYEIRIINAKGNVLTILLINLPIFVNDEIVGVYGIANDITKERESQRDLERILEEREKLNEELTLSNNELEQFAYIASHDLQEPLRMITGFLNLLEKKYKDQLDATGAKYIWFAVDGAVRMRKIISDLLEYSRVGRQNYDSEKIDTNVLLTEVMQLNSNLITETNATVNWGKLPSMMAARTPIQQVFHNLINNAIKYRQENIPPVITISGKETMYGWEFSVADNGIGIEKNFYESIFVIFQRLHHKNEFAGSGIGLAICKKIINNHNGKIWVKSVPGKGSTFYFTIGK